MQRNLRPLFLVPAALLINGLAAQTPYTLNVSGQLAGCVAGQQVTVQTLPGTLPDQSATPTVGGDCSFSATFFTDSPSGGVFAFSSCGNGTVSADSAAYSFSDFAGSIALALQLSCGSDTAAALQACITVTEVTPFTALFTSCTSGGTPPYTDGWLLPNGTIAMGAAQTFTFTGPGAYGVCMQSSDATGAASAACDTVFVSADGSINVPNNVACQAGFWLVQAYTDTSNGGGVLAPIPNEVWVLDLSSGANGVDTYSWDFGDGNSSTDAYPTHQYTGAGPYQLCLTITSGNCTDTFCDSVSVDETGILNGMIMDGHSTGELNTSDRDAGFTLNVIQSIPTGVADLSSIAELKLWPNPVSNELNITFNSVRAGTSTVSVMDMDGRTMLDEVRTVAFGSNTVKLNTAALAPGLYLLRIGDGTQRISQRFLKVR
ncbi:MAG: PKD domain-containing protein [Flavobacteriales bacterium]